MATVVVASNGQLSLANQAAEAMFGLVRRDIGRPFQDLEMSYRPIELRGWIEQTMRDRRAQWIREVEWPRSATETVYLDIELCPISTAGDDQIGVALYFSDVSRHRKLQTEVEQANRQLESAYEELQSTVEELETTNEELQSTVEELETTNEELQSTNEELETMNEELQSTNDELQAINDELRERTQEVNDVNEFFESVLAGLRAGIVVVDRELSVQVWNSWNEDVWGVRRDEAIGRNLLSLDIGLPVDRVRTLARSTLANRNGDNELRVEALNRRGRSVKVRVRAAPIGRSVEQPLGVLLMMETE
jgi:two-component system CheB/CheR fusion protein